MKPSSVREDLDQLIREWGSHRGAEISLLKGLTATNERLADTQAQLVILRDFVIALEARIKALGCTDHRFGDRGICFTCGQPRDSVAVPS